MDGFSGRLTLITKRDDVLLGIKTKKRTKPLPRSSEQLRRFEFLPIVRIGMWAFLGETIGIRLCMRRTYPTTMITGLTSEYCEGRIFF